jgi:hypothetical protein
MAMTPSEIYKALGEIRTTFPKSSKMFVGFIERADKTGALEGSTQRGSVIAMKNAWQLENKAPTVTFAPTDEKVIDYARNVAGNAGQSACKMLIVVDLQSSLTSVYVVPKGMCFIATAAYGSPMASEVIVLSQFRDRVLLRSKLGTAVVRLYYAVSPPLASCIDRKKPLKAVIRLLLLPILYMAKAWKHRDR